MVIFKHPQIEIMNVAAISHKLSPRMMDFQNPSSVGPVPPARSKRSSSAQQLSTPPTSRASPGLQESVKSIDSKDDEAALSVSQMRSLFESSPTTNYNTSSNKNRTLNRRPDVVAKLPSPNVQAKTPLLVVTKQIEDKPADVCKDINNVIRDLSDIKLVDSSNVQPVASKQRLRLKVLPSPSELGPPPQKPNKPEVLKKLVFIPPRSTNTTSFSISPTKRPPPKPPTDSRGKPLPPLPPMDDPFYDLESDNTHSSPAALGIPYDAAVDDELYQDTNTCAEDTDSIYESMEVQDPNERLNVNKMVEETRRKDKRTRREEEKRARERARLLEKFNLTGDERPFEMGVVRKTARGWNLDLSVKEGEKVAILRIKDNPVGRWLVANDRGKIGYVELTNLEVDPESIRSVMITTFQTPGPIGHCDKQVQSTMAEIPTRIQNPSTT